MATQANTYFDQALVHLEAEEYHDAIDMLTRAYRLSLGDLAEVLLYRGVAYAYIEAYDDAWDDFNDALRRNPYLADAYNERGNLLRLKGDFENAISDFSAVLHIEGHHEAAYYNRALSYEELRRYEEAEADFERTIEMNPALAQAYEGRGRVRARLRKYDDAIADLERYLRMGGGREYDNHSDIQSYIINLRINKFLSRFLPARFLPGNGAAL